jgi:hypothetical protein
MITRRNILGALPALELSNLLLDFHGYSRGLDSEFSKLVDEEKSVHVPLPYSRV